MKLYSDSKETITISVQNFQNGYEYSYFELAHSGCERNAATRAVEEWQRGWTR